MEVGVIFDIDDLGGGAYGQAAWAIVMGKFDPNGLGGCNLFSGDVDIAGNNRPYTFIGLARVACGRIFNTHTTQL